MKINSYEAISSIETAFFNGADYCILLDMLSNHYRTHSSGSIANTKGRIYEWLFAVDCINHFKVTGNKFLILKLPTVSSLNIYDLITPHETMPLDEMKRELQENYGLNLITSNPDFIILDTSKLNEIQINIDKINIINCLSPANLQEVDQHYRMFLQKVEIASIHGFISLKSSLRPDRRLQIVHEATITKAIFDIMNKNKKINFISASLMHNEKDKSALNTVAIHSLNNQTPEPAIDLICSINMEDDIKALFSALSKISTTK